MPNGGLVQGAQGRLTARAAAFGLACTLSASAPLFASENTVSYLAASVALLAACGSLAAIEKPGWPRAARRVALAWLAWSAFMVASLAWAPCFHVSALFVTKTLALYLAAWGLAFSRGLRERWRELAALAVAVAVLVAALGIQEFLAGKAPLPGWIDPAHHSTLKSRAASTFSNPNLLGAYLALELPVALGLTAGSGPPAILAGLGALTIASGLLLTFSRGGWLAGLAGLAAFAWQMRRHPSRKRFAVLAAGFAVVGLAAVKPVVERAATFSSGGELGIRQRLELYRGDLACIRAAPLRGFGLHAFETVYPRYRTVGGYYPLDAHNDLLQLGVEAGLPGMLLYGALLACALAAVWPASSAGVAASPQAAGLAAGIAAFLVATLFMGSLRYLGLQLPFWFAAAQALAALPADIWIPIREGPSRVAAAAVACLSVTYWSAVWATDPSRLAPGVQAPEAQAYLARGLAWMPWRHELHFALGRLLLEQGKTGPALAELDAAERLDPLQSDYARWRAEALARSGRLQAALVQLDRALAADPFSEDYLLLKGRLLSRLGKLDEACAVLEQALTTNEQYLSINRTVYPRVMATLKEVYSRMGRHRDAARLQRRLVSTYPELFATPPRP